MIYRGCTGSVEQVHPHSYTLIVFLLGIIDTGIGMESVFQTEKAARIFRLLLAAVILISAASCSRRDMRVQSVLASADSLMMTRPQAALDTLLSLDSTVVFSLRGRDRADFALLMTEARYKCYLPVAEDTAISEAADYYRRKGPDDRYARALTMQGAVLSERRDPEGAMAAYKEAEPIVERGGDLEQLGLLHTRIGELYKRNFINDSAAIARYQKALYCFEEVELPKRIMYAHVALANILMIDSTEQTLWHLEEAVRMADLYSDRKCGLSALLLMMHVYESKHDDNAILNTAEVVFSKYGSSPNTQAEEKTYRNILINLAKCYLRAGLIDSAEHITRSIHAASPSDSLSLYNLYAGIAIKSGDWKRASEYQSSILRLTVDMLQSSSSSKLAEIEHKYDNALIREELYRKEASNARIITVLILVVIAAIIVTYGLYRLIRRLRYEKYKLNIQLTSLKSENYRIRQERMQEEECRKELELMLQRQASANSKLMGYYSRLYNAMLEIVSAYTIYKDNPNSHLFSSKAFAIARNFTSCLDTLSSATELLNTAYPSFLDTLFKDYPNLKPEEKHIIILTCCGCQNHVVSSLLNISETNLSTRKTRIAKKMKTDESLSKFLRNRLQSYKANALEML